MSVRLKRVYDPAGPHDGHRVLVDRLWPRGLSKDRAAVDEWLRDVAPSNELRREFHGHPERWAEFKRAYTRELRQEPAATALAHLRGLARRRRVTLLYAAQDQTHNNAAALSTHLGGTARPSPRRKPGD